MHSNIRQNLMMVSETFASTKPLQVPPNVEIILSSSELVVTGPLGKLRQLIDEEYAKVTLESGFLKFTALKSTKYAKSLIGTLRSLVSNMITGVTQGFEKKLLLVGVGYRAQISGKSLNLNLGYSHPIVYSVPDGINAETPTQTEIRIKGIDKQVVGQVSAEIRAFRKPEPYKGKGVRFSDERILLKETKKK